MQFELWYSVPIGHRKESDIGGPPIMRLITGDLNFPIISPKMSAPVHSKGYLKSVHPPKIA